MTDDNRREFIPDQPILVQLTQDAGYLEAGTFGKYLRRDLALVYVAIVGWIRVPLDKVFQTPMTDDNRREFIPDQPILVQLTQDAGYLEAGTFGKYLRRDRALVYVAIVGWIRVPLDKVFQTPTSEILL